MTRISVHTAILLVMHYCMKRKMANVSVPSIMQVVSKLGPTKENPYTNTGPEVIPLDAYRKYPQKTKPPSPIDREDEKMRGPGFSWISKEDY
jgi:hypothetical protein